MPDANADIIINVDTTVGITEIKNLQRQIAELNAQLLKSGTNQARAAQNIQRNLINNINATGKFAARVQTISSTTESFTNALERNKLGMGQYFKYAGGASKSFGRIFKSEFNTIQKVAESRVKTLQTQYVKLGRDASGALKAISVRPLALDMENLATKTAIAAQKQQLFNQLVRQGSTSLLNFGKNTQWAGRQLMMGFTLPLGYLGAAAAKTFMKMEEQAIRFKRVYGDSFTATSETDKMIKQVQTLASEFTKYGVAVEETMKMAADAAAMGKQGVDLLAQVNQATTLSVLGGVDQSKALETTISLTDAFGLAAEELSSKIDFLNAVENQTVTAIEDLTIAIPKAAPVIKQLGGNVEDLAFFLTAMKEGGINASEGANALKSGLASLINPSEKSAKFLENLGISISGIVEGNVGDVKGTVIEFAKALDTLDPLNRSRAIEQLFGKFQFSRLSTLFQNVIKEGSQAEQVLKLTRASTEELAILSEREMKRISDSPMYKFKKAVEDLKVSLVPLGEAFLKAITPVVEFAKGFLDRFNEMSDGAKNFAVIATTVVAGIGPILLMTFGLVANGVANLIKMFSSISQIMSGAGKSTNDLSFSTEYMTQQQLEASAVAASLDQTHSKLIQTFNVESGAVNNLAAAYGRAVVNQSRLLGIDPTTGMPIVAGNRAAAKRGKSVKPPKKYAKGVVSVPGPKGAGDVVPAMLSPGEAVIPTKQSQKYAGLIQGMIDDTVPGFAIGRNPFAMLANRFKNVKVAKRNGPSDWNKLVPENSGWSLPEAVTRTLTKRRGTYGENGSTLENKLTDKFLKSSKKKVGVRMYSDDLMASLSKGDKRYKNVFETGGQSRGSLDTAGGQRELAENKMFGFNSKTPASARPAYGYVFNKDQTLFNRRKPLYQRFNGGKQDPNENLDMYRNGVGRMTSLMNQDTYRYGNIAMQLKKSALRGRTTTTIGDSLNATMNNYSQPAKFGSKPKAIRQGSSGRRAEFIEAQILGGFSYKDIKRIVSTEPQVIAQLQAALKAAGVKGVTVGMPKMTMLQRLRTAIDKKVSVSQKIPRMQSEGKYAGQYWTDASMINGRAFYNVGTTGAKASDIVKPSRYTFSQANTLESAHMSPAATINGRENFSREELKKMFNAEIDKGIREGHFPNRTAAEALRRKGINALNEKGFDKGGKLYGRTVGLWPKELNQAFTNKSKGIPASRAIASLNTMPNGMFGGSNIMSLLPKNSSISNAEIKKYSMALESDFKKRLSVRGNALITEDIIHQEFAKSQKFAESRIAKEASRNTIQKANAGGRLNLAPGKLPDKGSGSGTTRMYLGSNAQTKARSIRKEVANIFGYKDNFLSKNSVIMKNPFMSNQAKEVAQSMTPAQRKSFEDALSKVPSSGTQDQKNKAYQSIIKKFKENPNFVPTSNNAAVTKPKSPAKTPSGSKPPIKGRSQSFNLSAILRGGGAAALLAAMGMTSGMFERNQYNSGVVSVPGPKGAGDVVPAMLSPGEAIIPAKQSKKYAGLIQQMVHGKIPGYKDSNVPNLPANIASQFSIPSGPPSKTPEVSISPKSIKKLSVTNAKEAIKSGASKAAGTAGTIGRGLKNAPRMFYDEDYINKVGDGAEKRINSAMGKFANSRIGKRLEASPTAAKLLSGTFGNQITTSGGQTYLGGAEIKTDKNGRQYGVVPGVGKVSVAEAQRLQSADSARAARSSGRGGSGGMGRAMGIGGLASSAGMMMMFSGDEKTSAMGSSVMMGGMALSMVNMLANPAIATVAAIAGLGATVLLLNQQFKKTTKEAYDLEMVTGASSESLKNFSEFAGTVTGGETMDKRRANGLDIFQIAAGKTMFGDNFLQSENGKKTYEGFASVYSSQGRDAAAASLTSQMTTAVASGALSASQARDIVAAIGKEMNDYPFAIRVNGKLMDLLGVNGENLLTDPLTIRVNILESSRSEVTKFGQVFSEEINLGIANGLDQGGFVGSVAAIAGTVAAIGIALTPATAGLSLIVAGLATVAGGAAAYFGTKDEFAQSAEAIGGFVASSAIALQNQQDMVDSLQIEYEQRIANAKLAGDMVEAARLETEFSESRNTLMLENAKTFKAIQDTFNSSTRKDDVLNQYKSLSEEMYKDDPLMLKVLQGMESEIAAIDDETEVVIRASLLSGDLTPIALQNMLSSGTVDKQMNLLVNIGAAAATQANQLAALFGEEEVVTSKSVTVNGKEVMGESRSKGSSAIIDRMNSLRPGDALAYMDSFNPVIQSLSASGEESLGLGLRFYFENPEILEDVNKDVNLLNEKLGKEPITVKLVQEIFGQGLANQIIANQEYFDSLPDDQKIIYTTVLKVVGDIDPAARLAAALSFVASGTGAAAFKSATGMDINTARSSRMDPEYVNSTALRLEAADQAFKTTNAAGPAVGANNNNNNNNSGNGRITTYDELLKRLKFVRDGAIDAAGGFKELARAMKLGSVATTKFMGISQQLRLQGLGQEFIDFVNGLDAEAQKEFIKIDPKTGKVTATAKGKLYNKGAAEATLGEAQAAAVNTTADLNMQAKAFKLLVDSGLDAQQAIELSSDANLAYALVTQGTTEEIEDYVAWLEKAEAAQLALQLSTPEGVQEWLSEYLGEVDSATGVVQQYFDARREQAMLDFNTGTNVSGSNENLYDIGAANNEIASAQVDIQEYQYQIDDMQYLLDGIAKKEDEINKKYDDRSEALRDIFDANSDIAEQQKAQLDISQALASGDIAGAARAMQAEQQRRAKKAQDDQLAMLEKAREAELLSVTGTNGLTRLEIEEGILAAQTQIGIIEETRLEPNQQLVDYAQTALDLALKAIGDEGYLGQTEEGWAAIANAALIATTQSDAFSTSLRNILSQIPGMTELFDAQGNFTGFEFNADAYADNLDTQTGNPNQAKIDELNALRAKSRKNYQNSTDEAYKKRLLAINIERGEEIKRLGGIPLSSGGMVPGYSYGGMVRGYSYGGMVPKYFSAGGFAIGTDTVPAMLTPGEFVVSRSAVRNYGVDNLKAINSGAKSDSSVYNYNLSVNVQSEANPEQIARTVMTQIKRVESQRIRGNRY